MGRVAVRFDCPATSRRTPEVPIPTAADPSTHVRLHFAAGFDSGSARVLCESDSSFSSSSATLRSAIDCQRRSGLLWRQRRIILSRSRASPGTTRLGGSGAFVRIAASVDIFVAPSNARRPVNIS